MLVFPLLAAALVILLLAVAIASAPGRYRSLRSRGTVPFAYPTVRAVGLMAAVIVLGLLAWYAVAGPRD